ncbi:MAG TPA: segregation/condensation protein A, partial [Thermoanaerobaculia bacterium]|nr:segregation/condensation protein A [Thermoanaerobaculia bacterium]
MSDDTPELPDLPAPLELPKPEVLRARRRRKGGAPAEDGEGSAASGEGTAAAVLPESWRVQLPIFEGPLDLLLNLIKLNKVEITDIPVATICEQFHAYLGLMEELNLDIAGEYIYEAAVLIHLKSKMLLPRPTRAEGEPEEDPRQELVDRLLEYRRLKEIAQSFAEVDRLRMGIWTRKPQPLPAAPEEEEQAMDLGEVSLFDLLSALKTALLRYDREHPPPLQLSGEVYSVRGQFDRLMAQLDAGRPYDLLTDLKTRTCRAEAIATFLAVLELARLNLVRVHQTEAGDILLYRTTRELGDEEREEIGA